MGRLPPLNALMLWGATFYLATHGVLPPASTEAEARELAVALREAAIAWVGARVLALRRRAPWFLGAGRA